MEKKDQPIVTKELSESKKTVIIIGAILIVVIGLRLGLITALLGVSLAGLILKKYNIVSPGSSGVLSSAGVKETKGVRVAKYILLALVVLAIIIGGIYLIQDF